MDQIEVQAILNQVKEMFREAGFLEVDIRNETLFEKNGYYHRFSSVEGMKGFIIETAISLKDAENNLFEDSDFYSFSLGNSKILSEIQRDIEKYYT